MSVLAILEQQSGRWHRLSWETVAAGQQLAAALGTEVEIAVAGANISELAAEAATKKAAKIWAVDHELLGAYTADAFTSALESLTRRVNPGLVLLPHTYQTRDFAPKLATRF